MPFVRLGICSMSFDSAFLLTDLTSHGMKYFSSVMAFFWLEANDMQCKSAIMAKLASHFVPI